MARPPDVGHSPDLAVREREPVPARGQSRVHRHHPAKGGADVRILMADPDSDMCARRGVEEQLFDTIPARVRMALSYYAPLADGSGVDFRLRSETLYNSIFAYDDEMLINQHVYGMYGYMAPVLHLHRIDDGDFFDMYLRSFDRIWKISPPVQESGFWQQR